MGTKFYEVVYKQSENEWGVRPYTYKSELDLRLQQKVYAPTYKNPRQEAMIVSVNVPEPGFVCREITEVIPGEEEANA